MDYDVMGGTAYGEHMKRTNDVASELTRAFRDQGLCVLDYATPNLPFDPYRSGIQDFIAYADVIVTLEFFPIIGFSEFGKVAQREMKKPMFIFVPHGINLFRGALSRRCQRHFYCDSGYAALVVRNTLRQP